VLADALPGIRHSKHTGSSRGLSPGSSHQHAPEARELPCRRRKEPAGRWIPATSAGMTVGGLICGRGQSVAGLPALVDRRRDAMIAAGIVRASRLAGMTGNNTGAGSDMRRSRMRTPRRKATIENGRGPQK
jgi:hypothetical protein